MKTTQTFLIALSAILIFTTVSSAGCEKMYGTGISAFEKNGVILFLYENYDDKPTLEKITAKLNEGGWKPELCSTPAYITDKDFECRIAFGKGFYMDCVAIKKRVYRIEITGEDENTEKTIGYYLETIKWFTGKN